MTAERVAESVAINNGTKMPRSIMKEKDIMSSSNGMLNPHQMQNIEMNVV